MSKYIIKTTQINRYEVEANNEDEAIEVFASTDWTETLGTSVLDDVEVKKQ
tara:strand:+ start:4872 stop:5024 length:153 start_codon:yes stop_codon:yes gene_type:complete